MSCIVANVTAGYFETPDVVTEFGSPEQTSIGKIVQVAENSCLVDAIGGKRLGHFRVRERRMALLQKQERCQSGWRCPQAHRADCLLSRFNIRSAGSCKAQRFWSRGKRKRGKRWLFCDRQ